MSDEQELLPCPMCGGKAEIITVMGNEYFPRCKESLNGMCLLGRYPVKGEDGFTRREDAVKIWNRRWYPAGKKKRTITDFERFVHGKHGRPDHE